MAQAREASPFRIKEPTYLPAGASLERVDWVPPDAPSGPFSVDIWYSLPNRTRLHIWETNSQALAQTGKDPASSTDGIEVDLGGTTWRLARLPTGSGSALSTYLADGITVSINGILDDATLEAVAGSIA
jgi:hypothetical protein